MMRRTKALTYLLISGLGLTLVGVLVGVNHAPKKNMNDSDVISHRLDTLQAQLGALHEAIKKPVESAESTAMNQELNKLSALMEQLKSKENSAINQLLIENRAELSGKLDALHEVIHSLDKKQHPIKYLPVTALPFKVISIDSIQQVSVATVAYNFKTIPLEKSDKLANWTVLQIDFGQQRIELENSTKERVVVKMDGLPGASHA